MILKSISGWFSLFIFLTFLSCDSGSSAENQGDKSNSEKKETVVEKKDKKEKTIVFFGNSLTAGYGLEEGESFTDIILQKIKDANLNYDVVNAGLSGETTAGGLNRLDWILNQSMDIFVLELGANDMLRGFELSSTRSNLDSIVLKVKREKPGVQVVIAGMKAPPNLGEEYVLEFEKIYPSLAKKHNAAIIPFLLDGVAGNPNLNLKDGIHPNVEGQKIVAETVWKVLKGVINNL